MTAAADFFRSRGGTRNSSDLSQMQWNLLAVPAIVLVVMAVLQAVSFGKFKDWLDGIGVGWPAVVAVVIIVAELLGAASFLQIPMTSALRFANLTLAVLVTGFWFVENLMLVSTSNAGQLTNSGYFGKYLAQAPGWWSVVEISVLLFWVVYSAELLKWRPGR
jgi:hypothetical protein